MRAEILAARAEAKAESLTLGAKIVKRENEQDKRLDALENEAGLSNPNKINPHTVDELLCDFGVSVKDE